MNKFTSSRTKVLAIPYSLKAGTKIKIVIRIIAVEITSWGWGNQQIPTKNSVNDINMDMVVQEIDILEGNGGLLLEYFIEIKFKRE